MKVLKGWRKMSHNRGYQNEVTGQIVKVEKKEFTDDFIVLLIPNEAGTTNGKRISPDFTNEARAQEYAYTWMKKNPNSIP